MKNLIGLLLRRSGFEVKVANDAASALNVILEGSSRRWCWTYKMEEIDGLGLLTRLRDLGGTIPTVMLTAYHGVREAIRATRLGVLEYVDS